MQGASFTSARVEIAREQVARRAARRIVLTAVSRFGLAVRVMSEVLLLRL